MSSFLSVRCILALGLAVGAVACRRDPGASAEQRTASVTTLTPGSIAVLDSVLLKSGPGISGTLTAEREARVRAGVGGTVLGAYVDQGQRVEKGTLLVRIEDRSVQDAYLSARSQVRSAELNARVAKRNAERSEKLARAGAPRSSFRRARRSPRAARPATRTRCSAGSSSRWASPWCSCT